MYPEGFEDLEETEKGPKRTYVSSMNQQDSDKLLRENERLKKSLEKEKFFNKLLDQELKELKSGGQAAVHSEYPTDIPRGVSKNSFLLVLFLAVGMAGFIGYTLIYNKQYHLFSSGVDRSTTTVPQQTLPQEPVADNGLTDFSSGTTPRQEEARRKRERSLAAGAAAARKNINPKDSVPEIIGKKNNPAPPPVKKKTPATTSADDEYDEAEVEAELNEPVTRSPQRPVTKRPAPATSSSTKPAEAATPSTTVPPPPAEESKTVIGKYKVLSKANFYSSPDENALRSVFIRGGNDRVVEALEEKNGFIYVIYTNDLGYTSRGWLSKKDLTPTN